MGADQSCNSSMTYENSIKTYALELSQRSKDDQEGHVEPRIAGCKISQSKIFT